MSAPGPETSRNPSPTIGPTWRPLIERSVSPGLSVGVSAPASLISTRTLVLAGSSSRNGVQFFSVVDAFRTPASHPIGREGVLVAPGVLVPPGIGMGSDGGHGQPGGHPGGGSEGSNVPPAPAGGINVLRQIAIASP